VIGEVCTTKGEVELQIQETIHNFQIMPKQILSYTFILGGEWLKLNGVQPKLPWKFKT
jgi:hypothetical protein